MKFTMKWLAAGAALAVLTSASVAMASGGATSGTGVDLVPGGGGGGGGGSTAPAVPAPCGQLSSFKATGGNYHMYGAIWVSFTVKNCGPLESLRVTFEETPLDASGLPSGGTWVGNAYQAYLKTNDSYSVGNVDNDFAAPGTSYAVTIRVVEPLTGSVLATQTAYATTGTKLTP